MSSSIDNWHQNYDPSKFLSKVDLDKLIEKNEVRNENIIQDGVSPCILCKNTAGPGLVLNDKSYLCKTCYNEVENIHYPEKYEILYRNYIQFIEARDIAFRSFRERNEYIKEDSPIGCIAVFSCLLVFINPLFIPIPIILFIINHIDNDERKKKFKEWHRKRALWEEMNPEPDPPTLKHFHDPTAILTKKDKSILKIFNNWPGYPPFWYYLREVVLKRDENHCQVSGCPSRTSLHIHHKKPVSKGGEHVPNNLVTLCDFHHAIEPDEGHERIWGNIKTRYFTIVNDHIRSNRSSEGSHKVKAHIRRLELIQQFEIDEIKRYHEFACPTCGSNNINITVTNDIMVVCGNCEETWEGSKQLAEETGPRIAEILKIQVHKGIWAPRWDMLASRTDSAFRTLKKGGGKKKKVKKNKVHDKSKEKLCPKCGSSMRLIKPKRGKRWKKFWGCNNYRTTGCKGTRRA